MATVGIASIVYVMAQRDDRLDQLVRDLAELDPADQARVVAEAARLRKATTKASRLVLPVLHGGSQWVGGELSREALYGDDGR